MQWYSNKERQKKELTLLRVADCAVLIFKIVSEFLALLALLLKRKIENEGYWSYENNTSFVWDKPGGAETRRATSSDVHNKIRKIQEDCMLRKPQSAMK